MDESVVFLTSCVNVNAMPSYETIKSSTQLANTSFDSEMTCILQHPFTAVVAGLTDSGKSQLVLRLVDNVLEMIEPPPTTIWYCYGEYQPTFNSYPNVHFHEGLPESSDVVFDGTEATLLVLDDLMFETNELVADTFTKLSHHRTSA